MQNIILLTHKHNFFILLIIKNIRKNNIFDDLCYNK